MIVYIETNFILGQAKGQFGPTGTAADQLLQLAGGTSWRVVIPDVCLLEAWQAYARLAGRREQFLSELESQINDLRRDASAHAVALSTPLEQARIAWAEMTNEIERRFDETVRKLVGQWPRYAAVERIAPSAAAVVGSLPLVVRKRLLQPADHLILNTVLAHAAADPDPAKVFLSGNSKDFGQPAIKSLLRDAGVKYLPDPAVALTLCRRAIAGGQLPTTDESTE